MAVNLSIKGVPDELADLLRRRAERNHRSLQGELMAIVSSAVEDDAARRTAPVAAPAIERGTRVGWMTTEEVYAEIRRRFPQPDTTSPLGVDIIRADRDARSR